MLVPYSGLYYYGDRATGSGSGGGGSKGRAAVSLAGQVVISPSETLVLFAPTPKYDEKNELDTQQHRYVAGSTGYYRVYISLKIYALDIGPPPNLSWTLRGKKHTPFEQNVFVKLKFKDSGSQYSAIFASAVEHFDVGDYFDFFISYNIGTSSEIISDPNQSYVVIYQL